VQVTLIYNYVMILLWRLSNELTLTSKLRIVISQGIGTLVMS